MTGWTFSSVVDSIRKKVLDPNKIKAATFFTMKTSQELANEKYEADQQALDDSHQANNNLDAVVDESLELQRKQIARLLKCKSLYSIKFNNLMMERRERDCKVLQNSYNECSILAGFMCKEGYAIGIEVHADWYEQFTMTFGYLHDRDGDMQQVIGPMTYDEIVTTGYPAWFNEVLEKHRTSSIK